MGFKMFITRKSVIAELEINKGDLFHVFSLEISKKGVKVRKLLNLPF
jgi:hypothetical protein